jgi:hypothetical protein
LFELDDDEIDRQTEELEACVGMTIERCFIVMVPPDWYVSECTGTELFPCDIGPASCLAKGITPEELAICPCNCRGAIQDDRYILVTPELILYKAQVIRMVMGEEQWGGPLAHCL